MCHIVGTRWVGWMNWTYLYTSMSVNKKLERGEQQANDYSVKDNEHVNTVSTWEYGIRNATSHSHTYLSTQNMVKKENLKMANSTKMTQKALTERKMTETKNNKWKPFKIHTGIQSISCWFLFCLFFCSVWWIYCYGSWQRYERTETNKQKKENRDENER